MIYVTYDETGKLTGLYRQSVHPSHAGNSIPVDESVAQNWTAYQSNAGRSGVEIAPIIERMPTVAEYTAALEFMYDTKAKERRYDNRFTCALRAGYISPFQPEGITFATWMDTCNALAYSIMDEVIAGHVAQPTIAELIVQMPGLVWP